MLRIGLTGGIGSGKSAASDHFAKLGAEVIDTDLLSRELVVPGQPAFDDIVDTFGDSVLTESGELNRKHLRDRIFADPEARKHLENILHPRIRGAMLEHARHSQAPYVVFVIPLLIETGQQALVDRVLVIDLSERLQRQRVAARDGLDERQIEQILAAQASREQRLRAANDVICNDGGLAELQRQIDDLHRKYLRQSQD